MIEQIREKLNRSKTSYNDYPKTKISKKDTYECCASCGASVPHINGQLDGHAFYCGWKKVQEARIELETDCLTLLLEVDRLKALVDDQQKIINASLKPYGTS